MAVEGSFDNWSTRHVMQRSGKDFTIVKLLPPGVYQVRRGAAWRLPLADDEAGVNAQPLARPRAWRAALHPSVLLLTLAIMTAAYAYAAAHAVRKGSICRCSDA